MSVVELEDHYFGRFSFGKRRLFGRVLLSGPDTRLEVHSSTTPAALGGPETVRGITQSGTKISLCNLTNMGGASGPSGDGTRYYKSVYFPHYTIVGSRFIDSDKRVISAISFTTDGANRIFFDESSFGIAEVDDIAKVLPERAKKDKRTIKFGRLFYYVTRGPIITVQTKTITFEAFNQVSYSWPTAAGIHLDNVIRIRLQFKKPVKLSEAINAAYDFRGFCELLTIGPQRISDVTVEHKSAKKHESLNLIVSYAEKPKKQDDGFRRTLISAGLKPDEFQRVLSNWMKGHKKRRIARLRITQGLRDETFTIDRLIAAANAFDLLPFKVPALPKRVRDKIGSLRTIVKTELPSPYCDPVLGAIGRLKGGNLREKILARFRVLPASLRSRLPEMDLIIGHCVQARNYFVHGALPTKLSTEAVEEERPFFTQTLEFIFVTAELSDCGWDWESSRRLGLWGSFGSYLDSYQHALAELKNAGKSGPKRKSKKRGAVSRSSSKTSNTKTVRASGS